MTNADDRTTPPWWAALLVTSMLLALATRMLVAREQLAVAGAIVGYVGSYWLPSYVSTIPRASSSRTRHDDDQEVTGDG